jgi:carbonic anhydrase/acetyltransferase-like protein (isoleucine patch superfamily)
MSDRTLRLDPSLTKIDATAFVASNATIVGDVHVGAEASVWFGSIIRGDTEEIRIGTKTNIQDNSVIHADPGFPCIIGDEVTVGHRAIVHGARVENRVLIGMGATIMNGAVVGEESIIGANALIREGQVIPPGSLALGVPAKVVRQLSQEERDRLQLSAHHYSESGREYKAAGFEKVVK